MNLLDTLIIVILLFCLIRGLFRGLVLELSSIIGVIAGSYGAITYYPVMAQILSKWISDTAYRNIISVTLLFVFIFVVISLLGKLIKMMLQIAFMGWFDRLFGAGFGALKGCLIASVLVFTFTVFLPKGASIIQTSKLSPYISIISENFSRLVSPDMKQSFKTNIDGVKKRGKIEITL